MCERAVRADLIDHLAELAALVLYADRTAEADRARTFDHLADGSFDLAVVTDERELVDAGPRERAVDAGVRADLEPGTADARSDARAAAARDRPAHRQRHLPAARREGLDLLRGDRHARREIADDIRGEIFEPAHVEMHRHVGDVLDRSARADRRADVRAAGDRNAPRQRPVHLDKAAVFDERARLSVIRLLAVRAQLVADRRVARGDQTHLERDGDLRAVGQPALGDAERLLFAQLLPGEVLGLREDLVAEARPADRIAGHEAVHGARASAQRAGDQRCAHGL